MECGLRFPVIVPFVNVKLFIFYWSEFTFIWTCWFEFEISIPLKNKIFFHMKKKKYGDILGLLSVNFGKSTGSSNKDENREEGTSSFTHQRCHMTRQVTEAGSCMGNSAVDCNVAKP